MARRSSQERARIYGPPEFREYVDAAPCLVRLCPTLPWEWRPDGRSYREMCHARNGGTGRKADWVWCFVGCWRCHDQSARRRTFEDFNQGRLEVGGVVVPTLLQAAVATHQHFRDSEPGRAWLARLREEGDLQEAEG